MLDRTTWPIDVRVPTFRTGSIGAFVALRLERSNLHVLVTSKEMGLKRYGSNFPKETVPLWCSRQHRSRDSTSKNPFVDVFLFLAFVELPRAARKPAAAQR